MLGPRSQAHRFLSLFPFSIRCLHVFSFRFVSFRFLQGLFPSFLSVRTWNFSFLFFLFLAGKQRCTFATNLFPSHRSLFSCVYVCVCVCIVRVFTQVSAYKYVNVSCACVCITIEWCVEICQCVMIVLDARVGFLFSIIILRSFFFFFLAVPNGMGVEAGDALLDEGPQSLPAMRLWTFS